MRHHSTDTKGMIDQRFSQRDATMQDVNDGNAAFGPLKGIAQSASRIQVDRDDFETTSGSGSAQRIAAGCLSDTTF